MLPGSVDVLVVLDVLEQFADPIRTLKRWATVLKPDGVIVASIGNVRNQFGVQQLLYNGRWSTVAGQDPQQRRGMTLRDLADQLHAHGLWFDGPAIGTRQGLLPEMEPLVAFMETQGMDRERFTTELTTEHYVFRLKPHAQPSGHMNVLHVSAESVPHSQATREILDGESLP